MRPSILPRPFLETLPALRFFSVFSFLRPPETLRLIRRGRPATKRATARFRAVFIEVQRARFGDQGLSSEGEIDYAQSGGGAGNVTSGGDDQAKGFCGYGLGFIPWGIVGDETVWKRRFGRVSLCGPSPRNRSVNSNANARFSFTPKFCTFSSPRSDNTRSAGSTWISDPG